MTKFAFIGNRKFVLEEMIKKNLEIDVFVVKNSHLEKEVLLNIIPHTVVDSKTQLLDKLESTDFDVLIANGCPYILPLKEMKKRKYVNIHPSYLPDLRGIDPVPGSILFKRDSGATCHMMVDEIDSGDIISRVKIPYSTDLDVSLLYQLSFIAEKKVFIDSLDKNFIPSSKQEKYEDIIYYSRRPEDRLISFDESNDELIAKIKAFNNKSQGCSFVYRDCEFKAYDIDILSNGFLKEYSLKYKNLEIILCYEDSIILKKDDELIKLSKVVGPLEKVEVNSYIN